MILDIFTNMNSIYDSAALISYESLLLSQYHIKTEGLYSSNGQYFIYCPDFKDQTLSISGENLQEWFRLHKQMTCQISITAQLPINAVKIDTDLSLDKSGRGHLITGGDIEYEIDLLIPKNYPSYSIKSYYPKTIVVFSKVIDENQIEHLNTIFRSNNFPLESVFEYQNNSINQNIQREPIKSNNIFKRFEAELSSSLRSAWQEDEDDWISMRHDLLSNPVKGNSYKPDSLKQKRLRCLIDCSIMPPDNMHNYISMYEQICVVAPSYSNQEKILNGFGITINELSELVRLGRVQMLFPQSIKNYDINLIEKLIEVNRSNVHFSRKISAFTLTEIRKRNPLLFPNTNAYEKKEILSSLHKYITESSAPLESKSLIQKGISEMGHSWVSFPSIINQLGAAGISLYGPTNLLSSFLSTNIERTSN